MVSVPANAFLVLDIPEPLNLEIMNFRGCFQSIWRPEVPVAIGGVGPLDTDQSLEEVKRRIDQLASMTAAIRISFGDARKYPEAAMLYLEPQEPLILQKMREYIINIGIRADNDAFPIPHCTIGWFHSITGDELQWALTYEFTCKTVVLNQLSLYVLGERDCSLLHRVKLRDQLPSSPHITKPH